MPDSHGGYFISIFSIHSFVHLFNNNNNLNYRGSKLTRKVRTMFKTKTRGPEPRKHAKDLGNLGVFTWIFFSTKIFFENILDCTKGGGGSRSTFIFATEWMLKNPKGNPFHIFRHCDTQFSFFFQKFLNDFKGSSFHFFHILQQFYNFSNVGLFDVATVISCRYHDLQNYEPRQRAYYCC